LIIAIDGPAGSGKSAVAAELARTLGITHLDTGAMYRAVAWEAMKLSVIDQPAAVTAIAQQASLEIDCTVEPAVVLLNGVDVTCAIRFPEVTRVTYCAADNPDVRAELVRRQRIIASRLESVVTEGRDQGTVAFPDAEFKFFIDAQPGERARRRVHQLQLKGITESYERVLEEILVRDKRDRSRSVGPLKPASDAIIIDSSEMDLSEVTVLLAQLIRAEDKNV